MESLTINGTKTTIPRYNVDVTERVNVSYSEIALSFNIIGRLFTWLRKVENGAESYWKNTVGPILCCLRGNRETFNETLLEDKNHASFLMKNVKRIEWDKEKGRMVVQSKNGTKEMEMVLRQIISL